MKIMIGLSLVLCGDNWSQIDTVTIIKLIMTAILPLPICYFK